MSIPTEAGVTDLVARLRRNAERYNSHNGDGYAASCLREAADAIEQLLETARGQTVVVNRAAEALAQIERRGLELGETRGVLRRLVDLQNGPPLIQDAAEWDAVMTVAKEVLGRP